MMMEGSYMSEKKVISRNTVVALGIVCIILTVGLVGAVANYTSIISEKENTIASLNSEITSLQNQINDLNATYIWLKHHSFTYYTVKNDINISNVGIYKVSELFDEYTINGTITNIGNKPIETVYVYLILRNPDGTSVFDTWDYEKIENLYIGETATFEFAYITYNENQSVEILLIY
jgi:predicted PurR-regulated permease PerM